jgi:hypothetical protein
MQIEQGKGEGDNKKKEMQIKLSQCGKLSHVKHSKKYIYLFTESGVVTHDHNERNYVYVKRYKTNCVHA